MEKTWFLSLTTCWATNCHCTNCGIAIVNDRNLAKYGLILAKKPCGVDINPVKGIWKHLRTAFFLSGRINN